MAFSATRPEPALKISTAIVGRAVDYESVKASPVAEDIDLARANKDDIAPAETRIFASYIFTADTQNALDRRECYRPF